MRAVRGKVLFALDNTDQHRLDYLRGNPSLEGRMLFVSSPPLEPSAAFLKMNDVLADEPSIVQRVRDGFLIRTRADIPTEEARSGSTTRRDSAFRSGAHYVSTDYPETSPFGSGYSATLPDAHRARGSMQSRQRSSRMPERVAGTPPVTRTSLALGWRRNRVRSQIEHKGPFNKKACISAGSED